MDKSWISLDNRTLPDYEKGVQEFLEFAYSSIEPHEKIRCPCVRCNNVYFHNRDHVEADLFEHGFIKHYISWVLHGEEFVDSSIEDLDSDDEDSELEDEHCSKKKKSANMQDMLEDYYEAAKTNAWNGHDSSGVNNHESNENAVPNSESENFMKMLRDADQPLYPECDSFSKLSFILTLMHLKILNRWSNKSFSMLLEVLRKAIPSGKKLPKSYYEAKQVIRSLGLHYKKIHACVNDCILFRNEYEKEEQCPICFSPRYKFSEVNNDVNGHKKRSKIPQKVLRYFPLKPRLQRLFISKKTALDMRWHKERRIDDGVLRHPADAKEWKDFDRTHESFAEDPRNVRLGLATDGFNPFSNMSTSHSTWPIILLPYNLPPWKCLKSPFFILSMIIPGPRSPGNDIDVYLEPLIEELIDLWGPGVETYDASTGTSFFLRAAVLWTINDLPAYAIISGWSTKGYLACPICNKETCSFWLKNGKKVCYMRHRRFLPHDHKWRDVKGAFDGTKEHQDKPMHLSGDDVLDQLSVIQPVTFGKTQPKKRKRDEELNWKKCSIFFKLPYWRILKLRHNLDVMHIEKNVCDNILGTLLDIKGKTKDNVEARFDLQELGIRHQLRPKLDGNSYVIPPACHTLSTAEKKKMCEFLASVKFPDGYASNLSKCVKVKECRLIGMKTHDCHVILQKLLPLSIRGMLNDNVCDAIHELSEFFTELCSKALKPEELENLESKISLTLCKFERIFPPAFFDIMIHLPIHLAREAMLGGPVQYRWMYPIERYLCKLKRYVSNKAFPEGSIAEGYIAEECLTFCSMYLDDIETQFNKVERNYENCGEKSQQKLEVFSEAPRLLGKGVYKYIDSESWKQAHSYILKNCDEVLPFISEHREELMQQGMPNVEKMHEETFSNWFEDQVTSLSSEEKEKLHPDLVYLAYHPDERVTHYEACVVNGLRFHTKNRDMNKKTQNFGVVVKVGRIGI